VGCGVRYIHFHDFYDDIAFVGTTDGKLFGVFIDRESTNCELHELFDCQHTITNIRTARSTNKNEHFVIFANTNGDLYIFKGTAKQKDSYQLVT
jgi:hypothetical protein